MTWEAISNFFGENGWVLGSGGVVALIALLWTVFGKKSGGSGHNADENSRVTTADNGGVAVGGDVIGNVTTHKQPPSPKS